MTKLADNEVKPNIDKGSISTISSNEDLYNPFENRNLQHPTSVLGSVIHLLKSSLGTGILAMPNAFRNGGLAFGFAGTVVIGFLCTYCVHILVKTSHEICRHSKIPSLGFAETSAAAFEYGPKQTRKFATFAKVFVDVALVFTYFMGGCVYIVFIAESIQQLVDHWIPHNNVTIYMYMSMVLICLLFTIQVRELKHLVVFSFLANVFMAVSLSLTLYYLFTDIPSPSDRNLLFPSIANLPLFFSTVIFAMEGIGVILPIENNMDKPQTFLGCPGVLNGGMSFVVALYSIIGFFGYLKYGEDTKASVTLNLPVDEVAAQIVKLLIALAVFLTYNLQVYAPLDIIWNKVLKSHADSSTKVHVYQVLMRCGFVIGATAVAMGVPDLEPIIGLVGSVCYSTLGFMVPSVIETVWKWNGQLGVFKWRLIKNALLCCMALIALVSGSMQSIQLLLTNSNKK